MSSEAKDAVKVEWVERWARREAVAAKYWDYLSGPRKVGRWIGRRTLWAVGLLLRLGVAVALLELARRVVEDGLATTAGFAAAGLVVAAFVVLTMSPRMGRGLLARLNKFSLGPVGIEMVSELEVAAKGQTEDREATEKEVTSVLELRLRLERKLAYIAKDLLDVDGVPTFVTIGSLEYDGYISTIEAHTVDRLMALRDEDLALFAAAEKREFLKAADQVASNIRASVLNGLVRKLLKKWDVIEIPRSPRPDLLVEKDQHRFHVVPVFALNQDSQLLQNAKDRLDEKEDPRPRQVNRRVIVVPHKSKAALYTEGDLMVVTTDQLKGALRVRTT